jgi:hypothetical protein
MKQRWRKTKPKMKKQMCHMPSCSKVIKVLTTYEEEYCCDGYMCGCYGLPINPALCDECEEKAFGKRLRK